MKRFLEAAVEIQAPAGRVWEIITDTEFWPLWGPSVRAVLCRDRVIRLGSTGWVQTVLGCWIQFEVTHLVPGREWRWKVGPVQATGHRVEMISEDSCRLAFEVPIPAAPYWLLCAYAARRIKHLVEQDRF